MLKKLWQGIFGKDVMALNLPGPPFQPDGAKLRPPLNEGPIAVKEQAQELVGTGAGIEKANVRCAVCQQSFTWDQAYGAQ